MVMKLNIMSGANHGNEEKILWMQGVFLFSELNLEDV